MSAGGGVKRKHPEPLINQLATLDKDILDIVQHHGQLPSDDKVLTTLQSKVTERHKIQQRLFFQQKKKTTNKIPKNPPTLTAEPASSEASAEPATSSIDFPDSRQSTPELPRAQDEESTALQPPTKRNCWNWNTDLGLLRHQVRSVFGAPFVPNLSALTHPVCKQLSSLPTQAILEAVVHSTNEDGKVRQHAAVLPCYTYSHDHHLTVQPSPDTDGLRHQRQRKRLRTSPHYTERQMPARHHPPSLRSGTQRGHGRRTMVQRDKVHQEQL